MKDALKAKIDGVEMVVNRRRAEQIPERAFRFLRAVGLFPGIMEQLAEAGYTEDDHKQGWDLLHVSSGYALAKPARISESHRDAIMQLDAWDEPHFRRTKGALQHRFPSQFEYIFRDLSAQQGYEALQSVRTFLQRVEALRDGTDPGRTGTREQDKKAVELLEKRKILTAETSKQLHSWIEAAQELPDLPEASEAEKKQRGDATRALVQLVAWFDEWSEVAHAQISKRNYLISLGLAKRRTSQTSEEPITEEPADVGATLGNGTAAPVVEG